MPKVPNLPPLDRVFAHIERFSCACPACGQAISSDYDHNRHGSSRTAIKNRMTWNPFTQRLRCPGCRACFVVGLLLYPAGMRAGRQELTPPDTQPTREERMALRRLGGAWVMPAYEPKAPVNVAVESPCVCPPRSWDAGCPVHGFPV
jgi:hypothetical protein